MTSPGRYSSARVSPYADVDKAKQELEDSDPFKHPEHPANDPSHPGHRAAIVRRLESHRVIEQHDPSWAPTWSPRHPDNQQDELLCDLRPAPDPGEAAALGRRQKDFTRAKKEAEAADTSRRALRFGESQEERPGPQGEPVKPAGRKAGDWPEDDVDEGSGQ